MAKEIGANTAPCPTDVTNEAAMKKLVDETVKRWGKVDAALLNAGIERKVAPIEDYSAEMFDSASGRSLRAWTPYRLSHEPF